MVTCDLIYIFPRLADEEELNEGVIITRGEFIVLVKIGYLIQESGN